MAHAQTNSPERIRTAAVLSLFALVFVFLAVTSYTQESATWDEPQHLTAGYLALKLRDYRLDPENPPLLGMWAALPLLARRGISLDAAGPPRTPGGAQLFVRPFEYCHRFLYRLNDADRLLYLGRFMIVLLGVLLGGLVFAWARELFGFWNGVFVLVLYSLEPTLLSHARLVTTDFGVTCFVFGALYFLWRTTRLLSIGNLAGVALFFALAQVSKYTAILLAPIVAVLLTMHACRKESWAWKMGRRGEMRSRIRKMMVALSVLASLVVIWYAAIWTVYGFRYAPTPESIERARFESLPVMWKRLPTLSAVVNWVDEHHLLPNAASQGFLFGQTHAQRRLSFLAGDIRVEGRWYYFPLAFLIKTPLLLLLLILAGLSLLAAPGRTMGQAAAFILIPIAAYLGMGMVTNLNIGLRHILPLYPFALLLAGRTVAALQLGTRKRLGVLLAAIWALEFALAYPHCLAFSSELIGGPRNGYRFLVDSNLDWGQDLKGLKRWMDRNGVQHVNLSYFGSADPAYYGIECTHLPGSPDFMGVRVQGPNLPGHVAISVTNLQGVYLSESDRAYYRPLMAMKPAAVIGYSIHVYRLERGGWPGASTHPIQPSAMAPP